MHWLTGVNCLSFLLVVQFVLGVICFRALWISRRRSKSILTTFLILHTAFLEAVNIVGLVTSIISFYLVVTMPRISGLEYCDQYYVIARKIHDINSVSNAAFAISGSLTDAMLVSNEMFNPRHCARLTITRSCVADKSGN